MADYKYTGFDTYGYVEQIDFIPLNNECGVQYESTATVEPTLSEIQSFVGETYPDQKIISVPKDKCLRR